MDYGGIPGTFSIDMGRVALYVAGWVVFGVLLAWIEIRRGRG